MLQPATPISVNAATHVQIVARITNARFEGSSDLLNVKPVEMRARDELQDVRSSPAKVSQPARWDEFLDNPGALRGATQRCPGIELSNLPLYPGFDSADV